MEHVNTPADRPRRIPVAVHTVILGLEFQAESERYLAQLSEDRAEPIRERNIHQHRERAMTARNVSARADVQVSDRTVGDGARSVDVRQYLPPGPSRGTYLHFHGGGWVFGAAALHDAELAALCEDLDVVVISVDYRLAPEHPFPAALDDAETVARWLIAGGASPGPLAIGGESAGAHLAAVTLQRLAGTGDARAFCAANLVYGIYDLSLTPSQRVAEDTPRLTRADLEWYYDQVLPTSTPEDRRDSAVSPLYGDLTDMPPARFAVGTSDPLFDDSVFLAARWAAAGVPATVEIYTAGAHGFARQPNGLGALARRRDAEFLAQHLTTNTTREARA